METTLWKRLFSVLDITSEINFLRYEEHRDSVVFQALTRRVYSATIAKPTPRVATGSGMALGWTETIIDLRLFSSSSASVLKTPSRLRAASRCWSMNFLFELVTNEAVDLALAPRPRLFFVGWSDCAGWGDV